MEKIVLIEEVDVFRVRIEKLIKNYYSFEVDCVSAEAISQVNMTYRFKSARLILMDIDSLYGEEVALLKQLRSALGDYEVSIIVLSASADVSLLKAVIRAGANDFVLKPFTDDQLIIKICKGITIQTKKETLSNISLPTKLSHLRESEVTQLPMTRIGALRWHNDFCIGIKLIDDEHRAIIENYEKLYRKMTSGEGLEAFEDLLMFLEDYIETHFRNEEAIQLERGYSGFEEHQKAHEAFRIHVQEWVATSDYKTVTNTDLIRFNLFVKDWLLHHVLIEDQKIALETNL